MGNRETMRKALEAKRAKQREDDEDEQRRARTKAGRLRRRDHPANPKRP